MLTNWRVEHSAAQQERHKHAEEDDKRIVDSSETPY